MGAGNRSIPNLAFVDKRPPFFRAREKMLQVLAIDRAVIMIYLHPFRVHIVFRRSVPRATLLLALGWFTNAPSGCIAHPTKPAILTHQFGALFCQHLSAAWPSADFLTAPLPRPLLIAHCSLQL